MKDRDSPRLLIFANTSWYLCIFRRRLAERLKADGYEVIFAAPGDDYSGRLEALGRFVPFAMDRKGRNPLAELLTVIRVVRLVRSLRPEVMLTWTPKPNIYGGLASRVTRTPILPNVAGLGFAFIGGDWLARVAGLLYSVAFRKCPVVFFQNGHDRDQFLAAGWVREGAARVLPGSGVDLARFRPQPLRQAADFVFLFVGRLLADKGLRELIEAVRSLKKRSGARVRLRIAGFVDSGNPAAVGEDEVRGWQAEGVAEYFGPTDEPETLIAAADCVVLPSYREGMPRALLEAAACARPVITTDAPGCRDAVIDGETGFLCRPRDVASLAEAMRRMVTLPPAEREAMGRAGRAYMERSFSEEIVFAAYRKALDDVLGSRAHRPTE